MGEGLGRPLPPRDRLACHRNTMERKTMERVHRWVLIYNDDTVCHHAPVTPDRYR
jgi:hypothetical protein